MKFARIVFILAGIWGVLVIAPLYFMKNWIGSQTPPAVTHPEFYYGFVTVTLMWQIAFFLIARDPARYRAFIIPPTIAKLGYAAFVVVLHLNGEVPGSQLFFAAVDSLFAVLFLIAFYRIGTGTENHHLRRE
jgi:hypothetical protein